MMPSDPPFIDPVTTEFDLGQLRAEAVPLAGLIALVGGLAFIPFLFVFFIGGSSILGTAFAVLGQFILAVGTGIVLMYVIARGIQLADE
jgi:hypothetical protein